MRRRTLLLAVALGLGGAAAAAEPRLPDLDLTYAAEWNGIKLGDIMVTLKAGEGADCYRYESRAEPVGMVRMFYGKPRETSEFCIAAGKVVPRRFSYQRGDDSFTLDFDLPGGKVRDGQGRERDIPANAQDRFGLQQAMRLWVISNGGKPDPGEVEFALVDDDRVRHYRFAITGRETLKLPAGTFETVKVERVDNPDRISRYWVAPGAQWMPVKVESGRDGKIQLRMELRKG